MNRHSKISLPDYRYQRPKTLRIVDCKDWIMQMASGQE